MSHLRAVRFHEYGTSEVLRVEDLPTPGPGPGEVLVEVRAAGINPGETGIHSGAMQDLFPATFPSGQGSDLAGVVLTSNDPTWSVGDEVMGWSWQRSGQATHVVVPGDQLAVSAAAGGVGSLVVQMLRHRDVRVLAIAGASNAQWLLDQGAEPVQYGDGLADRLRAEGSIDAVIDLFGPEYVHLAVDLGFPQDRIETIISFAAAAELGVRAEGSEGATTPEILAEVAAFTDLAHRHTRGEIVLIP